MFIFSNNWKGRLNGLTQRKNFLSVIIIQSFETKCIFFDFFMLNSWVLFSNACLIIFSNLSQGSVKEVSRGRSRHWQLMSRLQSSGSVRLASNVDLSPFSHVIWLNKQDWKCSNVAPVDHAPFQLQRASKQAVKRLMPTFQNHAYGCWRMKAAIHRILLPF